VVHAVDDVGDVALARRGEQDLRDARRLEVELEAFAVSPLPGVVDENGVLDPERGVVDLVGSIGVEDPDHVAVGDDGVLVFVALDAAAEGAVDRVAPQQAGALGQIVLAALAHDDGLEAEAVAAAGLARQDAGHQPPDAAEPVEHDVLGLRAHRGLAGGDRGEILARELREVAPVALVAVVGEEVADVDPRRRQVDGIDGREDRKRVLHGDRLALHPGGEGVVLDDLHGILVDQRVPVAGDDHAALAIEPSDDGQHCLRAALEFPPLLEILVDLVIVHLGLPWEVPREWGTPFGRPCRVVIGESVACSRRTLVLAGSV
jgi:hypothetical protein